MKKIIFLLICLMLCSNIAFANPIIYEKPDVKIVVEGAALELEAEVPIIVNSRTLVPLRKLLVGLGVPDNTENIQWIGEKREVKVIYNGVTIDLAIDSSKGYINGQEYTLDSAPIIHRDRTYLPARFVGEALGYTISWDQYTPAVLVTSNKNMDKLTEILNDLRTAMENVNSYEVVSVRENLTKSNYNGQISEESYTITNLERADLRKKIVYTESNYLDSEENSFNFTYNTDDALYTCYKYLEDDTLYVSKWEKYDYNPVQDETTPFSGKEKIGLVKIDESLYGSLLCTEYENAYVISTSSNQLDILKALDSMNLYNEILQNEVIDNFSFNLAISKETKLPMELEIKFDVKSEENFEGFYFSSEETNSYFVEFSEYNQYLDIELPRI